MKFLFVLFIIINIIILSINKELIFVELQSRHGARAPLELNENNEDIIGEKWQYVGELTGVGQRMEYILGLRNRYIYITKKKFLSQKYDPHELLVYSTCLNRTLLSMTSQLQGLYPMYEKTGEMLNEQQLEKSLPPIDIDYDELADELTRIKNNSLPDFMSIIPIHMINPSEKKFNVFDYVDCKQNVEKVTKKNDQKKSIKDLVKFFKEKYSQNLTENNIIPKDFEYNIDNLSKICDAIIVDSTEGKEMKNFFDKTKFDKSSLIEKCKEVLKLNFRDKLYGDDDMKILFLEESSVLREMIHYMKQRVDADIKGDKIDNAQDYSRPKMVIISGHDTTVTAQVMFILKMFNLPLDLYELPTYSAQTTFEVTREKKNETYSDYSVTFYFNDKLILNITMDKFIKTVENKLWSAKQIDKFCYEDFQEIQDIQDNNNLNSYFMIILVVASAITLLLLIIIIIMIVKIVKKDKDDDVKSMDSDKLINEE